jgi:hypothetical protein
MSVQASRAQGGPAGRSRDPWLGRAAREPEGDRRAGIKLDRYGSDWRCPFRPSRGPAVEEHAAVGTVSALAAHAPPCPRPGRLCRLGIIAATFAASSSSSSNSPAMRSTGTGNDLRSSSAIPSVQSSGAWAASSASGSARSVTSCAPRRELEIEPISVLDLEQGDQRTRPAMPEGLEPSVGLRRLLGRRSRIPGSRGHDRRNPLRRGGRGHPRDPSCVGLPQIANRSKPSASATANTSPVRASEVCAALRAACRSRRDHGYRL